MLFHSIQSHTARHYLKECIPSAGGNREPEDCRKGRSEGYSCKSPRRGKWATPLRLNKSQPGEWSFNYRRAQAKAWRYKAGWCAWETGGNSI